jgi:hypothetical protein
MFKENSRINDKLTIEIGKNLTDTPRIDSNMKLELFGPDGVLKSVQEVHNDIYQGAQYGLVDQIADSPTIAKVGWVAVGTGVIASAPGTFATTKLTTEIARVATTTKTRTNNAVAMVATFGAGVGTGALTEIGTFDVVTANTVHIWMGASIAITKGALDTLTVTWTLTTT